VLCPYARRTLAPWRLPYGWKPYGWWWNQSKYHVDHIPTLCPIHIWDTGTNHGEVPPISGHVMKQTIYIFIRNKNGGFEKTSKNVYTWWFTIKLWEYKTNRDMRIQWRSISQTIWFGFVEQIWCHGVTQFMSIMSIWMLGREWMIKLGIVGYPCDTMGTLFSDKRILCQLCMDQCQDFVIIFKALFLKYSTPVCKSGVDATL